MKNENGKLYAIYKNDIHKGNERGVSENNAIDNYVIASMLGDFLSDKEFMKRYKAEPAIESVHFIKSEYLK